MGSCLVQSEVTRDSNVKESLVRRENLTRIVVFKSNALGDSEFVPTFFMHSVEPAG
jgi:hypothetical protein